MQTVEFILHGVDASSGTYLAWESAQCPPAYAVLDRARLTEAVERLARALPDYLEQDSEPSERGFDEVFPPVRPSRARRPPVDDAPLAAALTRADGNRFLRVAQGPMLRADDELRLMEEVARAALPEEFVASLLEAAGAPDRRVLLVLNTPPSCGQVPWELLPTGRRCADGAPERLLDVVDVVMMGAILYRDADPGAPHPDWRGVRERPGLYLVQPWPRGADAVLSPAELREWDRRIAAKGAAALAPARGRERADRIWLSSSLRADAGSTSVGNARPLSHLLYVGHMTGDGPMSRMRLADGADVFGRTRVEGGCRWFSADDLLHGTWGWGEYVERLRAESEEDGAPLDLGTRWPAGVGAAGPADDERPFDAPQEVAGPLLWPMPPRVGLIACQSGTEPRQLEPFGMVTAILEAGAELVMATRWTMLTDRFFERVSRSARDSDDGEGPRAERIRPFFDLSVVVDDLLRSEDPVHEMNEWKRERLRRWRWNPSPAVSPLTWAGLTAFRAPDRSVPAEADAGAGAEADASSDADAGADAGRRER